jgi:ABC-2 type transport system ATP-binding protein
VTSTLSRDLLVGRIVGWIACVTVAAAIGVPAPPGSMVGLSIALPCGIVAGSLLFAVLSRGWVPVGVFRRERAAALTARGGYLVLRSAVEEIFWRGLGIGAMAPLIGTVPALVVTTVGFAASHIPKFGRHSAAHLLTGAVFGGLYLVGGGLAAPIAAHATYNLLIAFALEARRPPTRKKASTSPRTRAPAVAELSAVTKRFGETVALDRVDLRVDPGETLALLGPNGAGKTTALAIMTGLRRPSDGIATLFELPPHDRRALEQIGVTPQETSFPQTLRVSEIVDLVRRHFPDPLPAGEVLEQFRLTHLERRQAGGLSAGERRRLAVALAFAGRPRFVLLDEPSTGLDVESRRALWRSIRGFASGGGTVLLTTHHLEEAEELASRVVVLESGRVVASGTPAALRRRMQLKRIRLRATPIPELQEVLSVSRDNGRITLYTGDAESVVRRLVHDDVQIDDLEVAPVSLEEAFLLLTGSEL